MSQPPASSTGHIAADLAQAMAHLRGRLRLESQPSPEEVSMPQALALLRIVETGPLSNATLAALEHVRPQSMNDTVRALHARGLVERRPDPNDRRKVLFAATPEGKQVIESIKAVRYSWLTSAIEKTLSPAERDLLAIAAGLIDRLAESG